MENYFKDLEISQNDRQIRIITNAILKLISVLEKQNNILREQNEILKEKHGEL